MPVIIENHTPRDVPDDQPHTYVLRINRQFIAGFEHVRSDGLAQCLRRAADAVDAAGEGLHYPGKPAPSDGAKEE